MYLIYLQIKDSIFAINTKLKAYISSFVVISQNNIGVFCSIFFTTYVDA